MSDTNSVLDEWRRLTEAEREALLPDLLVGMRGWRAWATDPYSFQYWLERMFEKRGRRLLDVTQKQHSAASVGSLG